MIDAHSEELASLYVLELLEPEELARFEMELRTNRELAQLVTELEASAASLVYLSPPQAPPAGLKARLLEQIQTEKIATLPRRTSWFPWAMAAGLAVVAGWLAFDRSHLQKEMASLRDKDVLAQMKIATMNSMTDSAPKGVAVVVWDEEKQQGILNVDNMPKARPDQDYQLWVVDPNYKLPVNAGVFNLENQGINRVSFKPTQPITAADKFAVSLEKKGGAPQHEGPIIMISQ